MHGRLIPLASGAAGLGSWNMAVDQALMESVDTSGIPVLRFYSWSEPTLSLGYFQPVASRAEHSASLAATCVRRSTGGGAILHDDELTYSIAMPQTASSTAARLALYRDVHQAIAESLSAWNVSAAAFREDPHWPGDENSFLCFQRRTDEDLVVSGYKVLGSAQRRTKKATLQHGSLLMRASRWAPELPGVGDLSSQEIPTADLAQLIAKRLEKLLGVTWSSGQISDAESESADSICRDRFGAQAWLDRR